MDPNPKKTGNNDEHYKSPQDKINEKIEKFKTKQLITKDTKDQKKGKEEETKKVQTNTLLEKKKKPEILTKLEKLNVDIPYNRE